jgi:serine/threonine protein kinase
MRTLDCASTPYLLKHLKVTCCWWFSYRCRRNIVPIVRHFPVASAHTSLPAWDADADFIADDSYGFIMPLMDTSLQSLCTAVMPTFDGCLPDLLVGVLGVQISAGLLHLQRHRVAHRDLKPDNILIATARVATSSTDAGAGAGADAGAGAGTVALRFTHHSHVIHLM